MINYSTQLIEPEDIEAVKDVLNAPFLTQGPVINQFEDLLCQITGSVYASCVSSATTALHIAYLALGVKHDDIVWTTPITFAATANAALYCGAKIEFVDIDCETGNICVQDLEEQLILAEKNNCLPKVITAVALAGNPANLKAIYDLSKRFGFKIVNDASHALGAIYESAYVGSNVYCDVTIFSFHPVKIITSGEGGALLYDCDELHQKIQLIRSHGIVRDKSQFMHKDTPDWYYEQQSLGYNYRLSEINAALGLSQLKRLEAGVKTRNKIAQRYKSKLNSLPLKMLKNTHGTNRHAYHLFVILLRQRTERDGLFYYLRERGISAQLHYYPLYKQPYFKINFAQNRSFQHADLYGDTALSIPMHLKLDKSSQDYIVSIIKGYFEREVGNIR